MRVAAVIAALLLAPLVLALAAFFTGLGQSHSDSMVYREEELGI